MHFSSNGVKKIRIAFVKFGGMAVGGSERFLQVVAAHLPREHFEITYYYCAAAPYLGSSLKHGDTNPERLKYMQEKGVRLVEFSVAFRDLRKPTFDWVGTNFWELFDETAHDLVFTVKAGPPEYPFNKMKIPVIENVMFPAGVDPSCSFHIFPSEYLRKLWHSLGGDLKKSSVIPLAPTPPSSSENLRQKYNIAPDAVVAGFHQRADDAIFSPVPLLAFSRSSGLNHFFILLGGGEKYRRQAKELGLKNAFFLPQTGDPALISEFLNTLDIFAHGRADGETYGTVLAEAMLHGKPCLSHFVKKGDNAQPETMGPAGWFAKTQEEYDSFLKALLYDPLLRQKLAKKAISHAEEYHSFKRCIDDLTALFFEICGKKAPIALPKKFAYGISPFGFLQVEEPDMMPVKEPFFLPIAKRLFPSFRTFISIGASVSSLAFTAAKESGQEAAIYLFAPSSLLDILHKTVDLNNWEEKVFVSSLESHFSLPNAADWIHADGDFDGLEELIDRSRPILLLERPLKLKGPLFAKGYALYSCKEYKSPFYRFFTFTKLTKAPKKLHGPLFCIPIEKEPLLFPILKRHIRSVNKELFFDELRATCRKKLIQAKQTFKKTPLYPLFYRGRNFASQLLEKRAAL